MDWIAPANSVLYWGAVTAFAFAIATGVLRRWVLGRPGVRRGVVFVAAFIGVALVAGLLPSVVGRAMMSVTGDLVTTAAAMWWSGALVMGVVGLGVLARAAVGDPSRGRRRCGGCWYDMSGTPGMVCPECGREAKTEKRMLRTRRRKRGFALAVVLLVGALTGAVAPVWEDVEWEEWVPDVALVAIWPWLEEDSDLYWEFEGRFADYDGHEDPRLVAWRTGWRSRLMVGRCLVVLRKGDRPDLMGTSIDTLDNLGDISVEAREQLFVIAEDPTADLDVRATALSTLASFPSAAERVHGLLVAALDGGSRASRLSAMVALSLMSQREEGLLLAPPRLIEIAGGDAETAIQLFALRVLANFRRSEEAADVLLRMVDSLDPAVRRSTIRSLAQHLDGPERLLLRLAADPASHVRLTAVYEIVQRGPFTDEGFDAMLRIAELSTNELGDDAEYIFGMFAEAPIPIEQRLMVLERTLDHETLRAAGLNAIGLLGDEARPLVPRLMQLRDDFGANGTVGHEAIVLNRLLNSLAPDGH